MSGSRIVEAFAQLSEAEQLWVMGQLTQLRITRVQLRSPDTRIRYCSTCGKDTVHEDKLGSTCLVCGTWRARD